MHKSSVQINTKDKKSDEYVAYHNIFMAPVCKRYGCSFGTKDTDTKRISIKTENTLHESLSRSITEMPKANHALSIDSSVIRGKADIPAIQMLNTNEITSFTETMIFMGICLFGHGRI